MSHRSVMYMTVLKNRETNVKNPDKFTINPKPFYKDLPTKQEIENVKVSSGVHHNRNSV